MIKNKRLQKIEEYIITNQSVSLDELMEVFDVSKNTIRRDVQDLLEKGGFKKVYGGITVDDTEQQHTQLESFQTRQIRNQDAKVRIARSAADFIEDGDIIFIDSGTTTIELIHFIHHKTLTIITNNLDFIVQALPYENLNIITIGGILDRKTNSFGILKYMDILNAYNINKAFMASTGVSLTNGVTNALPLETELKRSIVERCSDVYLLVDHQKFDKYGLMTYCKFEDLQHIVTDEAPTSLYEEFAAKHHVSIVVAQ